MCPPDQRAFASIASPSAQNDPFGMSRAFAPSISAADLEQHEGVGSDGVAYAETDGEVRLFSLSLQGYQLTLRIPDRHLRTTTSQPIPSHRQLRRLPDHAFRSRSTCACIDSTRTRRPRPQAFARRLATLLAVRRSRLPFST
jgi:hypothetical protein